MAGGVIVLCRLATPPAENINFAFVDPIFNRSFSPAPLHIAIVLLALAGVAYGLTHAALRAAAEGRARRPAERVATATGS
jgi:hypothetical protein